MTALSPPVDLAARRIFVTGGTGFVGKALLDYVGEAATLHGAGFEIVVLSRDPDRFARAEPALASQPWLTLMRGDIVSLKRDGQRFTDVIHAAADTHGTEPREWIRQIVGGTEAVLDYAVSAGAQRFLLVSSGAVYGPQPPGMALLDEDYGGAPDPRLPGSVYGQAKRLAEQLCTAFTASGALETVSARCFALLSEHMPFDGPYAIGNFIRDALDSDVIRVLGDGTAVRSYLYGRDMAHWLFTLLLRGQAGEAYNVGSDQGISMADLAALSARLLAPAKRVLIEGRPDSSYARTVYVPAIKSAGLLGLTVEMTLERAIICTAERAKGLFNSVSS